MEVIKIWQHLPRALNIKPAYGKFSYLIISVHRKHVKSVCRFYIKLKKYSLWWILCTDEEPADVSGFAGSWITLKVSFWSNLTIKILLSLTSEYHWGKGSEHQEHDTEVEETYIIEHMSSIISNLVIN